MLHKNLLQQTRIRFSYTPSLFCAKFVRGFWRNFFNSLTKPLVLKGYNTVNCYCDIQSSLALNQGGPCNGIRGEKHRLTAKLTKCHKRKMFISNRVAASWNKLPAKVVASSSVNQFKNRFDAYSATR